MTYYFDDERERVAKSTGKLYLFGTGSAPVVETDVNGAMNAEYVLQWQAGTPPNLRVLHCYS